MNHVKYFLKQISVQKSNTLSIKFHLHNTGWQSISISQYLSVCLEQNAKWDQIKSPIKRIAYCVFSQKPVPWKKWASTLVARERLLAVIYTQNSKQQSYSKCAEMKNSPKSSVNSVSFFLIGEYWGTVCFFRTQQLHVKSLFSL